MNQLQQELLKMMAWLHNFCVKHHLTYYISGGTFLGAIRHKGFIPWDDDIDIALPRRDYMKILDLLKQPIDGYYIESPYSCEKDFPYSFGKFYNTRTTMTEETRRPITRGIFIDVFPIDGLGNNTKEAKHIFNKGKKQYIKYISKIAFYSKNRKWYKNVLVFLNRLIPYSEKNVQKNALKLDRIRQRFNYSDSSIVGVIGIASQEKEIMLKETYGKPRLYPFEGFLFYGPEDYDTYLKNKYSDYMVIPPKEKQIEHEFKNIDFSKGWK